MPVLFFESISIPIPHKEIYRRLGFTSGVTKISPSQREEIERYIQDAVSIIQLKGVGLRVPILGIKGSEVSLGDGLVFESQHLAKFLRNCDEIVLMAATAGDGIINAIEKDITDDNVTHGVVLDATASEMVDASLDWIMDYFNRTLLRENRRLLRKRYSAGYGDLPLETQKTMYQLLELERIGIQITETCILVPEKSVTAITGIKQE
ncbi:MAG TPA: vitamin B12 dependent-methionine synthase activation domain-containing protein [Syntrophales bacterium]|nr:vitamin B12 dependent-methionine synthase activation domain-containing protein [Syntrophales bacterium]